MDKTTFQQIQQETQQNNRKKLSLTFRIKDTNTIEDNRKPLCLFAYLGIANLKQIPQ